jgi:nitroreductase
MDVLEAIRNRRSVRNYSGDPIPADVLQRLRQALRWAPSACNFQPWHFVFVQQDDLRRRLAEIANDQAWIADAPVIVVACGLPNRAYQRMGGHTNTVDIDVAIAIDHLTLAATAEGLGTCWIGAFDEGKAKMLVHVPPPGRVVAMTPLGYPAIPDLIHPVSDSDRKPPEEIFGLDRYGNPGPW